ncbi:hypothetical protein [Streptomyces anulatus]|uniref:hypothetical protein n=1 Tax=Streptomyces anulatus TaxID=1892 RepID=UPI002F9140C6
MNPIRTRASRLRLLGPTRLRLALLLAAFAATTLTLLTSLPAHAEPTPLPSLPAAGEQRTPTAEEQEALEEFLREQGEKLAEGAQKGKLEAEKEQLRKLLPDEGGVLGVFNVTDVNNLPISVYTVKSETGDLVEWELGVYNMFTEFAFLGTKWIIGFCCWLIAWALSFGLAKLLLAPVLAVAESLHTRVILELGLPFLFLSVCAIICVARILFGDRAKGWGDAALSILLAALTTTLLASPPQTLLGAETGAIAVARGMALEVADVILDADPVSDKATDNTATSTTLSRPLTDALTDAFIVRPAMLLQYGRVFEGECAAKYADTRLEQLVFDRNVHARTDKAKKLTGLADYLSPIGLPVSSMYDAQLDMSVAWAVDHFGDPPMERFEADCVPGDAAAAKRASLDKLGGAVFLLLAALIVTLLIVRIAGTFLVAQCRIAWDAIRGEPALIIGTIPGAGRAYLWDWAASVLRSLGQMITSVVGLAVFIIIVQAVLDPVQVDWGNELTLRFVVLDFLCIGAFIKRKKLSVRTKQTAANIRGKLSAGRIGGTHGSPFAAPASSPVEKNHHVGRKIARGVVRTAMVGASVAYGNPLAALGHAMPRTVGATALMSQIGTGARASKVRSQAQARSRARSAGRPVPSPTRSNPGPPQRPANPPARPSNPPRPTNPPPRTVRPTAPQRRRVAPTARNTAATTSPGSPMSPAVLGTNTAPASGATASRAPKRNAVVPTTPSPSTTSATPASARPSEPNRPRRVTPSSSRITSNEGRPAPAPAPAPNDNTPDDDWDTPVGWTRGWHRFPGPDDTDSTTPGNDT